MLNSLYVKNYALINEIQIDFVKGLNIITGETGAGKSILLGALGLIMGKRADTKVLFDQGEKCVVEAKFDVAPYKLSPYFDDNDLEYSDELIIRREIASNGKSRAFINDMPSTLDILQDLSGKLIDLHQQFDMLDIHKPSFQIEIIDALAANQEIIGEYSGILKVYKTKESQLKQLLKDAASQAQELEFTKFQYNELTAVKIETDEYENLGIELDLLTSTEDIKQTSSAIFRALDEGEKSVIAILQELNRKTGHILHKDKRFELIDERLTAAAEELRDISSESEDIFENTEYDERRVEFIQERLGTLHRAFKKYNVESSKELIDKIVELENRVSKILGSDEEVEGLANECKELRAQLLIIAQKITLSRETIFSTFQNKVTDVLDELSIKNASFEVKLTKRQEFGESGTDIIEYFFAANKGGKLLPLKDVASGGEISRLTLAIKSIVASAIHLPTMIFDEIDMGISGDVAAKMGNILQVLSKEHQIISITHSPQIAAKANKHFFVYKQDVDDITRSALKTLDTNGKIYEIAKMLSTDPPSEAALLNAKELIEA
jgi:DNA repair protein RecN (Recombination protein N)